MSRRCSKQWLRFGQFLLLCQFFLFCSFCFQFSFLQIFLFFLCFDYEIRFRKKKRKKKNRENVENLLLILMINMFDLPLASFFSIIISEFNPLRSGRDGLIKLTDRLLTVSLRNSFIFDAFNAFRSFLI